MSFSLTIRRLGVTAVLTFVILCGVGIVSQNAATLLFLPCWAALFFGWPRLSRKLGFNFPKPAGPRKPPTPIGNRLVITATFAILLSLELSVLMKADVFGPSFLCSWLALFFGWPYLSRRLAFLRIGTASTDSAQKRPLWLRAIRSTFKLAGGIVLAIAFMASIVVVPLTLSEIRARNVHDAIHIGMTVPEVLHVSKDYDAFQASSDFSDDEKAEDETAEDANTPGTTLTAANEAQGDVYRTYDLGADLRLSESATLERLHAKLHDGCNWRFSYLYVNMTPAHVSFSVVFGPDGRVSEIESVRIFD